MAKVRREQIESLAGLAHLSLTGEERNAFASELERILEYAENIQDLDTEGVEPSSHALLQKGLQGASPALRDDEPRPPLDRHKVLAAAPDDADGLFKVPKVLP